MVDYVEQIKNWYTEGTTQDFYLKIALTIAIVSIIIIYFYWEKIKEYIGRLSNDHYVAGGDDGDMGKHWDKGLDNVTELRKKINQVKDPSIRYNEIKYLIEDTEKELFAIHGRIEKLNNIYRDLYKEYDDLKNELSAMQTPKR